MSVPRAAVIPVQPACRSHERSHPNGQSEGVGLVHAMQSYSLIEKSRGGLGSVSHVGSEISSRRCTAWRLSSVEGGLGTSSCRSSRHGVPGLDGGGSAQVSEVTGMHAFSVVNVSEADSSSEIGEPIRDDSSAGSGL